MIGAGGTRTHNQRIMSQNAIHESAEENAHSESCAAPGAADESKNGPIDPDLQSVIDAWETLPDPVKAGILAMVRAAR